MARELRSSLPLPRLPRTVVPATLDPNREREPRDRRLEYREGKGADQEQGAESTRGKDKGRDTPDDDFSL